MAQIYRLNAYGTEDCTLNDKHAVYSSSLTALYAGGLVPGNPHRTPDLFTYSNNQQ